MVTAERFQHEPLDALNREIRLVQILPTSRDDRIRLAIKTVPLRTGSETQDNSYVALSYAYGNDSPSHPHWFDDRVLYLNDNISSFIKNCLLHNACLAPAWIWVDSICINQQDLVEKAAQVLLMANIYTQATKVFIWLGDASQKSVIAEAYEKFVPRRSLNSPDPPPSKTISFVEQRVMGMSQTSSSPDMQLLQEILDAFKSPYWSRLWIVQECALAHDPQIIFGQYQMSLFHLGPMATRIDAFEIRDLQDMFESSWPVIKQRSDCYSDRIVELASAGSNLRPLSLRALMSKFGRQRCSLMRDKIYGLLGLLHMAPDIITTIKVDYQCSFEAILPSLLQIIDRAPPRTQILNEPSSSKTFPMEAIRKLRWRLGLDLDPDYELQESVERVIADGSAEDAKALTDDVLKYSVRAARWVSEDVSTFRTESWLSIEPGRIRPLKSIRIDCQQSHHSLRTLVPCKKAKLVEDTMATYSNLESKLNSPFLLHIDIEGLAQERTILAGALLGCTSRNTIQVICFAAFEGRLETAGYWKCAYLQHDRLRKKLQAALNTSHRDWMKLWPTNAMQANDRPGDKLRDLMDQDITCSVQDAVQFVEIGDAFCSLIQDKPSCRWEGEGEDEDGNEEERTEEFEAANHEEGFEEDGLVWEGFSVAGASDNEDETEGDGGQEEAKEDDSEEHYD